MSDSIPRPWHGAENPLEALHDWMLAELAALRASLPDATAVPGSMTASEGAGYTTVPAVTSYNAGIDQTPPPVPPEQAT